ncbi:hypothetical protein EYF80_015724 [Liparis tanakae]|uniref:Uncharacterized protein n=1 Tax=Liparis tanakae TaxID=230148 RepID=A0A4Z2IAB4_9TELE|nr:hypothetical protein EYF80_015724 [Liparis tanakae]
MKESEKQNESLNVRRSTSFNRIRLNQSSKTAKRLTGAELRAKVNLCPTCSVDRSAEGTRTASCSDTGGLDTGGMGTGDLGTGGLDKGDLDTDSLDTGGAKSKPPRPEDGCGLRATALSGSGRPFCPILKPNMQSSSRSQKPKIPPSERHNSASPHVFYFRGPRGYYCCSFRPDAALVRMHAATVWKRKRRGNLLIHVAPAVVQKEDGFVGGNDQTVWPLIEAVSNT